MRVVDLDTGFVAFEGPLFGIPREVEPGVTLFFGADPAPAAPGQFQASDWSVATGLAARQIVLNIAALPAFTNPVIAAVQYNIGAGWVAISGTGTGARTLTMENVGQEYTFSIRAVNAIGAGVGSATKTVVSNVTPSISDFYGTGPGMIPMDLRLDEPVISGADVMSVRNDGGAGSMFAVSSQTGTRPRWVGDMAVFETSTGSKAGLDFANAPDLFGTHVIFAVLDTAVSNGFRYVLDTGSDGTEEAMFTVDSGTLNRSVLFRSSAAGSGAVASFFLPLGTNSWSIVEFRIADGMTSMWLNGGLIKTVATPTFTQFLAYRIGYHSNDARPWRRGIGRLVSVVTAQSDHATPEPVVLAARAQLAAQYGVVLP